MINRDNGNVTFPGLEAAIGPSLTRAQFLQTLVAAVSSVGARNEPWCSYRLPNVPQPETILCLSLQFHGERLESLNLFHNAARFGASWDWDDWSEERELARKSFHEHWLVTKLGVALKRYSWGEISSNYDAKGGSSSITIRYAKQNM